MRLFLDIDEQFQVNKHSLYAATPCSTPLLWMLRELYFRTVVLQSMLGILSEFLLDKYKSNVTIAIISSLSLSHLKSVMVAPHLNCCG